MQTDAAFEEPDQSLVSINFEMMRKEAAEAAALAAEEARKREENMA